VRGLVPVIHGLHMGLCLVYHQDRPLGQDLEVGVCDDHRHFKNAIGLGVQAAHFHVDPDQIAFICLCHKCDDRMRVDCGMMRGMTLAPLAHTARVMSAHGRLAWVQSAEHGDQLATLKGRALQVYTNDLVTVDFQTNPPSVIAVQPRQNRLYREEGPKEKTLAANVDGVLILLAGHPGFSPEIALRVMGSLVNQSIPFTLVLNKWDREHDRDKALALLEAIQPASEPLAWPCVRVSSKTPEGLAPLMEHLQNWPPGKQRSIALAGQSGMGKSTLLNALVPGADALTQAVSEALQSGKHTTTASRGYAFGKDWIIDTPGFQRFGISHITAQDLMAVFPEWETLAPQGCRYTNCQHDHEPHCGVRAACDTNPRLERRRQAWLALIRGASAS